MDQARSLVVEYGYVVTLAQRDQVTKSRPFGESLYAEVRLVDAQDEARSGRECIFVVDKPGAVGSAYLAQDCAGLGENLGDAKPASDLDQFPARNNHFSSLGQRVQRQEGSGSAVVNDQRGVPISFYTVATHSAQKNILRMHIPPASLTGFEIELEVGVAAGCFENVLERGGAQGSTPQVCMENDPGGIDNAPQAVARAAGDVFCNRGVNKFQFTFEACLGVTPFRYFLLHARQHPACGIGNRGARLCFKQRREARRLQQIMQGRQQPVQVAVALIACLAAFQSMTLVN